MAKIEYKVVEVPHRTPEVDGDSNRLMRPDLTAFFNKHGQDGWVLCLETRVWLGAMSYVFRREID